MILLFGRVKTVYLFLRLGFAEVEFLGPHYPKTLDVLVETRIIIVERMPGSLRGEEVFGPYSLKRVSDDAFHSLELT